jgi:hypothetical protein
VRERLEAKKQVRELKRFWQTRISTVAENDLTCLEVGVGRDDDDPGLGRRFAQLLQSKQVLAIRKIRDDNHCTVTSDPTHARAASTVMAKSAQKP